MNVITSTLLKKDLAIQITKTEVQYKIMHTDEKIRTLSQGNKILFQCETHCAYFSFKYEP